MSGNVIRMNRERLGLTREQLAEQVGVSVESIKRWENGACPKSVEYACRMDKIFGAPGFLDALYEDSEK